MGYLEFLELTGFAGWWVGDSVSGRFARMQVSDFAVGGGWWVLLRGIRSLARQQAKELRIREIRICTGTIGIVSVDLVVTRCH